MSVRGAVSESITITTSYVDILTLILDGRADVLNLELENTGAAALTGFKVLLKDHADGEWYDFLSGVDFDSTDLSNMLFASATGPHELGAAAIAHAHVRVNAAYGVKFQGLCGSSTTVVLRATPNRSDWR